MTDKARGSHPQGVERGAGLNDINFERNPLVHRSSVSKRASLQCGPRWGLPVKGSIRSAHAPWLVREAAIRKGTGRENVHRF
jgi:hypothetical protein